MNGKKMTRALNRVAEPVKEESMWKGRAFAEVLRAALVIVMVAGLGVGSGAVVLAQRGGHGGKPPKKQTTYFQVKYETDPSFNILPDGEGLFGGLPCPAQAPDVTDCPTLEPMDPGQVIPAGCQYVDCYVDLINDSVIFEQDGLFKQLQERDLVLREIYSGIYDAPHYRHFETDIEFQAIEGNEGLGLCPELIDPTSDWTLGGGYDEGDAPFQKVLFSLWVDVWPEPEQAPSWSTGRASVKGAIPLGDELPETTDFDADGEDEELLRGTLPRWELVWDAQESGRLDITPEPDGTFRVESSGQAMLRVHPSQRGNGKMRDCGLVDADFAFVATAIATLPE